MAGTVTPPIHLASEATAGTCVLCACHKPSSYSADYVQNSASTLVWLKPESVEQTFVAQIGVLNYMYRHEYTI